MLVEPWTQIQSPTPNQMYSWSVNMGNFSVAFLLLCVSFSFSFSLYDVLFFWACSHHHVVLSEKRFQQGGGYINLQSTLQCTILTRSSMLPFNTVYSKLQINSHLQQNFLWTLYFHQYFQTQIWMGLLFSH